MCMEDFTYVSLHWKQILVHLVLASGAGTSLACASLAYSLCLLFSWALGGWEVGGVGWRWVALGGGVPAAADDNRYDLAWSPGIVCEFLASYQII